MSTPVMTAAAVLLLVALSASSTAHAQSLDARVSFNLRSFVGYVASFSASATSDVLDGLSGRVATNGTHIFVAQNTRHRVLAYAITKTATGSTVAAGPAVVVAGSGIKGLAGDGCAATSAKLSSPSAVAVSGTTLWVADWGNCRIRKVNLATKVISTVVGTKCHTNTSRTSWDAAATPATSVALSTPWDVIVDKTATFLYIADPDNRRVRRLTIATGLLVTLVGPGGSPNVDAAQNGDGGAAANATLLFPASLQLAGLTTLYIADPTAHVLRAVRLGWDGAPASTISTVAGVWRAAGLGDTMFDSAEPTTAKLVGPWHVAAVASSGYSSDPVTGLFNLWLADKDDVLVLRVNNKLSTLTGAAGPGPLKPALGDDLGVPLALSSVSVVRGLTPVANDVAGGPGAVTLWIVTAASSNTSRIYVANINGLGSADVVY